MADQPTPKSYEQLLSDMLRAYAAKMGINDFNVGSAITSFFEVVALTTARSSGDIFQILRDFSVDRATGEALRRLATENRVKLITALPATGSVTVTDSSFNKIATKIYAGSNPPNTGSTEIRVSDASAFPASGNIYIGRGTPNVDGPLSYTSITPSGNFYIINLSTPTTKFHNLGEEVVLAQGGNRSIPTNTVVISPASGASQDIQFRVTNSAVILDGEVEAINVQVSAQVPGAQGNVPRRAIREFSSPPFPGAIVTNPLPFTTGKDNETDDELRVRIKRAIASRGLGTATAIKSAVIGATASDEQATVISNELINTSDGSVLYIDDGTGYEAKTSGVGLETVVSNALGGEKFFQLITGGRQAPVAKAFLETALSSPFDLIGGDTLAITVGEQTYQHVFSSTDFRSPGGATAFEVAASINTNTIIGFEASTSEGGQKVIVRSKSEGADSLKVSPPSTSGRDAAVQLGFPTNEIQTLRPYRNKIPLSKDGRSASVFSKNQQDWAEEITNGDTLIVSVDGTDSIAYSINNSDFIATGLFSTVSKNNSLESWVEVFNKKLTGVTASIVGQQIRLTSNLGITSRAKISIDPSSSLVLKGMFASDLGLESEGKSIDFYLSRNTAQFELVEPLQEGDELTLGTRDTEARISSNEISGNSISFSADAHLWILIDSVGEIIETGVSSGSTLNVSKPSSNVIRYESSASNSFSNVEVGDYVIIWSEELNTSNRLEGRVNAVTSTTIDVLVTSLEYSSATIESGVLFLDGFVVLRSSSVPQKFKIASGIKTLDSIVLELESQTNSLSFEVEDETFIIIKSKTKDTDGSLLIVTSDSEGRLLGFNSGDSDESKESLIAFYESQNKEGQFPLFLHSKISDESFADPVDSFISSFTSAESLANKDPNDLISILHPYGDSNDAQAYGQIVQENDIVGGTTVEIEESALVKRLRNVDRFFIASPLDFGYNDSVVSILDNDTGSKSFEIPLYRKALTNTSNPNNSSNFNAYDVDSGPTTNFSSSFGDFDFSNFKVLMQAKKVLKHQEDETAILFRAARFGRSGEKIKIGYIYPSAPNAEIGDAIFVSSDIDIKISLKSGDEIGTPIHSSTQWNVSITANTPIAGVDQVTFTWNGVGNNPNMTLSGGEYVNISSQTDFNKNNVGVFRVSDVVGFTPTATSFTVQMPNGIAVDESDIATSISQGIIFYSTEDTTSQEIVDYVNDTLSDYLSATIVDDNGQSGAGIIYKSTFEDSDFQYEDVQLKDGINWILSSDLTGSPQFVLKRPLELSSDVGYEFNDGEELRLIPTTIEQTRRLLSILAVTGFTTSGSISSSDASSRLELSTNVLGSQGAIQIVGGIGNKYEVPVLDSASRINNSLMSISVDKITAQGAHSDQWFKLQASFFQKKEISISSNSSITIESDTPSLGKSKIKLLGRAGNQRYFGKPRHHVRTKGNTFRIEKQGSLVCLSWDGIGSSPSFIKSSVDLDDSLGGTLNIKKILNTSDLEFSILSGNTNFTELSIGDLLTIQNMANQENNGTFLITYISEDGTVIRVLNAEGVDSFSKATITLDTNLTAGDTVTVGGNSFIADTDFVIELTKEDTAQNLAAAIDALTSVSATASSNVISIVAAEYEASIALSYSGVGTVTLSSSQLEGDAFVSGDFSASTEVSEGDTLIISDRISSSSSFSPLNVGTFRVIRRFNNSVWFENETAVEEEVELTLDEVDAGIQVDTSLKVNATNNSMRISWNGGVSEPNLENIKVGDVATFGIDFDVNNRGDFMVIDSGEKLQEIIELIFTDGSTFTTGDYFTFYNAGDANLHYVWFNVDGGGGDPSIIGATGIEVAISSSDSDKDIAEAAHIAISATAIDVTSSWSSNSNQVILITDGYIETSDAQAVSMPSQFVLNIKQKGRRTFFECINPPAVNENPVFDASGTLVIHRPEIQFFEYEATVPGDKFVITGNFLGSQSRGSFIISEILNRDTIIVNGTLSDSENISLNNREAALYVEEGIKYSGYKKVNFITQQPGALSRALVVFDTNSQYSKINESASVQLESLNKLDFSTSLRRGLDSYRYNTGLIAEANRIIYGDPRDPATYPGVGAAGAEIFVREPLSRRIQVSIVIRVNTGVPFAQMAERVRTNVSSLINSNPVGQPISISSIVSTVNQIPGMRAVSISSPQYDPNNDIIFVAPSEKARIIDPVLDISVSLNT